jgi:hypothetical protein
MARVMPISRSAVMRPGCSARCASWITTAMPPRPTPSTPTAARTA